MSAGASSTAYPFDPTLPLEAAAQEHSARKLHDIDVLKRLPWGLGIYARELQLFTGKHPHRGAARQLREGAPG